MKGDHAMKRRWYTQLSGMTLVGLLTLTGVGVLGFRPAAHADGGGIEGTWLSAVKIVSCDDPDVVFATFESMTTYMHGGTLIEGGGRALRLRRSRAVPVTASGSARAITPFTRSSASTVLTIWAVSSESRKSPPIQNLSGETTLTLLMSSRIISVWRVSTRSRTLTLSMAR